jgi:hypothetical protein
MALSLGFSKKERGKRGNLSQSTMRTFFKGGEILNQGLYHSSQNSALCHNQKRSMQGSDSGAYKNFHLGFNHINVNVRNLFLLLNVVWLFYITFN